MATWGLTFDEDVAVCDGRELEIEPISQGGKTFHYDLKGLYDGLIQLNNISISLMYLTFL